jgi:hypothetical protein
MVSVNLSGSSGFPELASGIGDEELLHGFLARVHEV